MWFFLGWCINNVGDREESARDRFRHAGLIIGVFGMLPLTESLCQAIGLSLSLKSCYLFDAISHSLVYRDKVPIVLNLCRENHCCQKRKAALIATISAGSGGDHFREMVQCYEMNPLHQNLDLWY